MKKFRPLVGMTALLAFIGGALGGRAGLMIAFFLCRCNECR
jgi:hypothetical protein